MVLLIDGVLICTVTNIILDPFTPMLTLDTLSACIEILIYGNGFE